MRSTLTMGIILALLPAGLAIAQEHPARIAIYKPLEVMQKCKEYGEIKQKFDAESARLNAEEAQRRNDITKMAEQQRNLKHDSPAYGDLTTRIEHASVDLELWGRTSQGQGQRAQNRAVLALYQKIEAAAEAVARQDNWDVVLMDWYQRELPQPPELDRMTYNALLQTLALRNISSATRAPDITEKIILRLDSDYAKGKIAPAAGK